MAASTARLARVLVATDLDCLIVRNRMGSLRGYVGSRRRDVRGEAQSLAYQLRRIGQAKTNTTVRKRHGRRKGE